MQKWACHRSFIADGSLRGRLGVKDVFKFIVIVCNGILANLKCDLLWRSRSSFTIYLCGYSTDLAAMDYMSVIHYLCLYIFFFLLLSFITAR